MHEVSLRVCGKYLTDDLDLEDEFNEFKKCFKEYAINFSKISDAIIRQATGDLTKAIEHRKADSKNLLDRFGLLFDLTDCDLQSVWEKQQLNKQIA